MTVDTTTWAREHSAALVGLPAAAAEQEVADAGLRPRIVAAGVMLTLEYRPDRITLQIDERGIVTGVAAG